MKKGADGWKLYRKSKNRRFTRKHQAHPNAGASFHPRSLFRGLSVPYNPNPGQKYLHPELHRKAV